MKRFSISLFVALTTFSLTSCGDFMTGLASGLAGYNGGGYYAAPAPAMNTAAGFNSFPAATFTAPAATYTAPAATYTAPAATYTTPATTSTAPSSSYGTGSSSSGTSSSSSSGRSCGVCYGSGKCRTCNGNGTYWDSLNGNRKKCPNCTNGLCTSCGGSGKR